MTFLGQGVCLALLGAGLVAAPTIQATASAPAPQSGKSLVQQMKAEAEGPVRLRAERATGKVGFVQVRRDGDLMPSADVRPTAKARQYLDRYAAAFGARSAELEQTEVRLTRYGTTVSYDQVHRGVPVFGAALRAHLDEEGDLTSINGFAAPDLDLSVEPRLTAAQAGRRAVAAVKADPPGHHGVKGSTAGLEAVSSDLMVYRTGSVRGETGENVLVYVVEASNGANVRDMVFVDAASGKLVNRYSLVHDALDRKVYEQSYAPESLVWQEGDPFPGDLTADQQNIVEASGESYWFFQNAFGRDSYDGEGHTMETVNNDPRISCPNANWNGTTTNYCNGVTSDDVVAHEWGHAYTEETHGLIYQWQPGALNESYSDIWGETVDLINGRMDEDEGDITTKRPDGLCSKYTRGAISMVINSPASAAGPCTAAPAAFGPVFDQAGVTTDVVVGTDDAADGSSLNGCTAFTNASQLAGKFVYVDRGVCTFATKANNADAAGATGIIVGDNVAGRAPISMSGAADIYGAMVTLEDGARIKSAGTVNATIKDSGTDPEADSYRWLIGEDSSAFGGAIRDMWTPTCYGDPAKVSDAQYHCATDDAGGVHSNSGVPNHAYALTVDGGSYNGQSITGIGLTKAAAVYFRAMVEYQTPTTDFADHADALRASCTDLVGQPLNELSTAADDTTVATGTITAEDCLTFETVAAAVELRKEPTQCNFQPMLDPDAPSLCGEGTETEVVWSEDFEDGLAGWGTGQQVVYPGASGSPWEAESDLPGGREGTAAYGPAPDQGSCDGSAQDFSSRDSIISPVIRMPDGTNDTLVDQKLSFDHYVATETGYDGGNVKWRRSGSQKWKVIPASAYTFNAPTRIFSRAEGNTNPLAGEDGFTGTDGGEVFGSWGQSQVDLAALKVKGGKIQIRFDIGRDGCGGLDGWYVDDIQVTVCAATEEAVANRP